MRIIAIHDGHTASIAYMENGKVEFAIQEERLTKIKNSGGFPKLGLLEILKRYNLDISQIDHFVFSGTQPQSSEVDSRKSVLKKYQNLFNTRPNYFYLNHIFPFRRKIKKIFSIFASNTEGLSKQSRADILLNMGVGNEKISYLDHHLCHAAAAAYGWGTDKEIAVITSDSAGDGISGSVSIFKDGNLERKEVIDVGDSVARIYSLITYYMGMVPMEHEYKLMGLAAYVEDSQSANEIADYFYNLFEFNEDGISYRRKKGIEPVYFFGDRLKEYLAYKRFDVVCAGLQLFIEKLVTNWVRNVVKTLGVNKVAFSGGLFMNVKLNKVISELKEIDSVFFFPSCGDESNVFGALYFHYHQITGKNPIPISSYYLGGDFKIEEIESALNKYVFKSKKIKYERVSNVPLVVAKLLANNEIVARFDGRMEFGARALGNRSIIANPSYLDSVKIINKMIKSRDFWMPFAPSMVNSIRYLINPKNIRSPYMMMAFDVQKDKIKVISSALHAYDNTCRPQEVLENLNKSYFDLINEFEKLTGESVILNTSFNLHGFPIVYTPEDALYVFDNSGLKYLIMGEYLINKE